MRKTDDELLAEANALDATYAAAELHDLRYQIEYLRKVLANLYYQTQEDALRKTKDLESALDDAAEALGLFDI